MHVGSSQNNLQIVFAKRGQISAFFKSGPTEIKYHNLIVLTKKLANVYFSLTGGFSVSRSSLLFPLIHFSTIEEIKEEC